MTGTKRRDDEATRPPRRTRTPRAYKKRGFGRLGERCPTCGGPISHGRSGNPAWRKGQPPCMKPTALAPQVANDDARGCLERKRAQEEAWERLRLLKKANAAPPPEPTRTSG